MARISSDGKHFEVVAPTKRRKSESAGPTAAELNQAYREKSEQDQRVEKTKKDAAYTRKYLGAKRGSRPARSRATLIIKREFSRIRESWRS